MDINTLTAQLRDILGESAELDERSQHWPFAHKSSLGPSKAKKFGPPPGSGRTVKKKDDWVCKKKGKYVQLCKGPEGRKKIVRIDPSYKASYNKAYRAAQASSNKKSKKKAK